MIILDVIIIMVVGFVPFVLFITLFRAMNMSILHLFVPLQRFTSKLKRKKVYENIVTDLPRTSLDQVHELHTVLNKAKVKAPYIIVAHSIGIDAIKEIISGISKLNRFLGKEKI